MGAYPTFYTGVSLAWSADVAVLLTDASGNLVDFFCAGNAYPAYITTPTAINEPVWSGPPLALISGSNPALTYQRRGYSNHHNAADWIIATNSFLNVNPQLQFPFISAASSVAAIPASITLANGVWSGQMTVDVPATNTFLRADNGLGITGDSTPFNVLSLPALHVQAPHAAYKSTPGLVGQAQISISLPVSTNVQVALTSSLTNEIAVPTTVLILAGATNVYFPITNFNNGLLEGPQPVTIEAKASRFAPGSDIITNYDFGTAAVTVSAPVYVSESSGWLFQGQVGANAPVSQNVTVQLSSSDTSRLIVPDWVIIPAGQSSAKFGFAVVDNQLIDGNHFATINASVPGWTGGQTQILIADNENANLTLALPNSFNEDAGVLTNAGEVQISGILSTDLMVNMDCSVAASLQVPASVVIPAGQSSASFDITVPERATADTNENGIVTASANGFLSASKPVSVIDDHVRSFALGTLPQSVMAGAPIDVTIYALNTSGSVVPGYSGTVGLRAAGDYGNIDVMPSTSGPFTNGIWSGSVALQGEGPNSTVTADDGLGHSGFNGLINVVAGHQWNLPVSDFTYDSVRGLIQAALLANAFTNAQCVVQINPSSGDVAAPVPLGNTPGEIALSDDSQFLYVALTSTGGVARVNLASRVVDLRFGVGSPGSYPYVMAVPPAIHMRWQHGFWATRGWCSIVTGLRSQTWSPLTIMETILTRWSSPVPRRISTVFPGRGLGCGQLIVPQMVYTW